MDLNAQPANPPPLNARAMRVVAKSLIRHLREQGLRDRELLAVTTELLGLIAERLRNAH